MFRHRLGALVHDRDEAAAMATVLLFAGALGLWLVTMPLLALAAGWDAASIGVLAAISAVTHLLARSRMGWLLERVPDRRLVGIACLLMASPYALLVISQAPAAFVLGQLLMGSARALFWTASQTHAVRGGRSSVRAMAQVNVVGSIGQVSGPIVAGVLISQSAIGPLLALGLGAALGGALASLAMELRPVYARRVKGPVERWWRNRSLSMAATANFSAGGWQALLGSYVPVVLDAAGHDPALIGLLVSAGDGAAVVGSAAIARVRQSYHELSLRLAAVAAGGGMAVVALLPGLPAGVALALLVSGFGAGLVTTLSPAMASDAVEADRQGGAIALSGLLRAAGQLSVPATAATLLSATGIGVAMAVSGVLMSTPSLLAGLRRTPAQTEAPSGPAPAALD